jgi:hypothetical protein
MPNFTVDVTWRAIQPLTQKVLFRFAALGGAAAGDPGGRLVGATFSVNGESMPAAAQSSLDRMGAVAAGEPVSLEVMTHEEQDRRLAEPAFPELVGVAEIAEMIGVNRQRASAMQSKRDFPAPVAVLRAGPVWRRGDLTRFVESWDRRPGRRSGADSKDTPAVK